MMAWRGTSVVAVNLLFHWRSFTAKGGFGNDGQRTSAVKVADERSMAEGKDVKDGDRELFLAVLFAVFVNVLMTRLESSGLGCPGGSA